MLGLASLLAAPLVVGTQGLDICGCATLPDLQAFDSRDPNTYPPGTTLSGDVLTIPLPADGILEFASFYLENRNLVFQRNAANTPVTILVAGNVTMNSTFGCCYSVNVSGVAGLGGTGSVPGVGSLGGPGGFRGGDGAQQATTSFSIGGAGFGPGGGLGGAPLTGGGTCSGAPGQFFGAPDLTPLLGGAGGGGGCSSQATSSCSGGGGGGGGGALIMAANGTLTMSNYRLFADGGGGGNPGNGGCSSAGGPGSGGAIRLVTNRFVSSNAAEVYARGGGTATHGRIRLESMDTSSLTSFLTDPPAQRIVGPTPLANPVAPTVSITSVGGNAVPAVPQGTFGSIDVVVPVPGATSVDVATSGIPGGTTVQVTVKPRLGAQPISTNVPLSTCNTAGDCQATALFTLPAGAYVVEARATFQIQ
jgi:hypothetical protein